MAHFAQLDENNTVVRVIVVSNDDIRDPQTGEESESLGIAFCKNHLGSDTNWKQTSYTGSIRVRYCGPGYTYNEELDAFIPPKPFESWILDEVTADWISPIGPAPELSAEQKITHYYKWDEENSNWSLTDL